jgi:hypothetical protein
MVSHRIGNHGNNCLDLHDSLLCSNLYHYGLNTAN